MSWCLDSGTAARFVTSARECCSLEVADSQRDKHGGAAKYGKSRCIGL